MLRCVIVIALALLPIFCFAQNKMTGDSLKYGHWRYVNDSGICDEEGIYVVTGLSQYNVLKIDTSGPGEVHYIQVRYKNGNATVYVNNLKNDSLSVHNGIWVSYDSVGRMYRKDMWENGINIWTKYYDHQGEQYEYHYKDYENDSDVTLSYIDYKVFKKSFYPSKDGNNPIVIYYPGEHLIIPNAEPEFYQNFITNPVGVVDFRFFSKKLVKIISITGSNNDITFRRSKINSLKFPIIVNTETQTVQFIYKPHPIDQREYDTITIKTSEPKENTYKIICHTLATHVDFKNGVHLKSFKLSRSKDKYLYLEAGGEISYHISGMGESLYDFTPGGRATRIDISNLENGDYTIDLGNEENSLTVYMNIID